MHALSALLGVGVGGRGAEAGAGVRRLLSDAH